MISERAYDEHIAQMFDVLQRVTAALRAAGIDYRLIGGAAVFLHVAGRDPMAARTTRDIDIAVHSPDLPRMQDAVQPFGFHYLHTATEHVLVDAANPKTRSAVHCIAVAEPAPAFSPAVTGDAGALLAPVADLVRMKLTSYRLKDRVHIQDMDSVCLITPEIESALPDTLRERLAETRATR